MANNIVDLGRQERNAAPIVCQELAKLGMFFIPTGSSNAEQSEPQVLENRA